MIKVIKTMKKLKLLIFLAAALFLTSFAPSASLLNASGKITLLRVHDVGTGYGPTSDFIDVEAVIQLDTKPGSAFGFQLRNDNERVSREAMLNLLRDAFRNNWTVSIDYNIDPNKKNGIIIRAWVQK